MRQLTGWMLISSTDSSIEEARRVQAVLSVARRMRVKVMVYEAQDSSNKFFYLKPEDFFGIKLSPGPERGYSGRGLVVFLRDRHDCIRIPRWTFVLHEIGHAVFTESSGVSPDHDKHNETQSGQDVWERAVVARLVRAGRLRRCDLIEHSQFQVSSVRPYFHAVTRFGEDNYRSSAAWKRAEELAVESGALKWSRGVLIPTWQWPTFTPAYEALHAYCDKRYIC